MPDPYPAPPALAIVQEFVNTAGCESQAEQLSAPRHLARWLSRRTLLPAGTKLTEEDRLRAIEVREGIRALLHANAGWRIDPKVFERLDQAISGARFQLRFDQDGSARFEPSSPGLEEALAALLEIIVVEARVEGIWRPFKACALQACGRAFYDTTKGLTGKYCTKRCGDKVRARAARRRSQARR